MDPETESNPTEVDFESAMRSLAGEFEQQQNDAAVSVQFGKQLSAIEEMVRSVLGIVETSRQQVVRNREQTDPLQPDADGMKDLEKSVRKLLEEVQKKNSLESANEKLFEAMHKELRGYKDAFLFEALQLPVARDLIQLLDDLQKLPVPLEALIDSGPQGDTRAISQTITNIRHSADFLMEILHRLDVEPIPDADRHDRRNHRVVEVLLTADAEEDGRIAKVVRAGYRWRERVLRPTDVILFKKNNPKIHAAEQAPKNKQSRKPTTRPESKS